MRKRRHHSVWQYYLRSWTLEERLYCLQGQKIFKVGTGQVAVNRDLYSLEELSVDEQAFIRALASPELNSRGEKKVQAWLDFLSLPARASELLTQLGAGRADPLCERLLNFGEDFQSYVEDSSVEILDAMRRADASFLSDDKRYADFLFYMLLQFFRTSKWQRTIVHAITPVPNVRLDRVWRVLLYIFADNLGEAIYVDRRNWRLVFLESCASTPFVTCDQPLVNAVPLPESGDKSPEELKIYYPVSPQLAVYFSRESHRETGTCIALSEEETHAKNCLVRENAHRQVFSQSRNVLELLRQ